jgi:hypothetical protein
MKKLIAVATLLAIGAVASAQSASSVNAAGFVKKTVAPGQLVLIQNPFEQFDGGTFTVADIFGTSLPNGTIVYAWSQLNQRYAIETLSRGAWTSGDQGRTSLIEFSRADGMFVSIPANAPLPSYDIFLFGEVPDSRTAVTTVLPLVSGFQMIGYPYPVSKTITETSLASIASAGDVVYSWNGTGWLFEAFSRGAWSPGTMVLNPGQAVFYSSVSPKDWTTTKPYNWP